MLVVYFLLVLILIALVVGFLSIGRIIKVMREDIRAELDALHQQLTDTSTVAEGVVTLIETQNAKLSELADSGKDGDTIAAELRDLVAESDAVKAKLANAVAAGTAATSDAKPVETPIEEPPLPPIETPADTGGDGTGGGTGGGGGGE